MAAESPLEFPADVNGDWAKADLLVKRFMSQALSQQGAYTKVALEVVTGPQWSVVSG